MFCANPLQFIVLRRTFLAQIFEIKIFSIHNSQLTDTNERLDKISQEVIGITKNLAFTQG